MGVEYLQLLRERWGARSRKKETIDARPASRMVEKSKQRRKRKQILLKFPQMFVKDPLPQAWSQIGKQYSPHGEQVNSRAPEGPAVPPGQLQQEHYEPRYLSHASSDEICSNRIDARSAEERALAPPPPPTLGCGNSTRQPLF